MRTNKGLSLTLAIMWTVCLVVDIISAACGDTPSWVLVFCPLVILVFDRWDHYAEAKERERLTKNDNY